MPGLVEIGPFVLVKKIFKFRQCIFCYLLFLEKKMKMRKVYDNANANDDDNDDIYGQWTNFDQKGSLEFSAQVN